MRKILVLSLVLITLFVSVNLVLAQGIAPDDPQSPNNEMKEVYENESNEEMMEESTDTKIVDKSTMSAYELFWPVVAGKTRGESLYFLKRLKEKIRGALIFGDAQKTEYRILLSTKRILEADKLLENKKTEHAIKALEEAKENLEEARESWHEVENPADYKQQIDEMNNKLENIETFLEKIKHGKEDSVRNMLQEVHDSAKALDSSI